MQRLNTKRQIIAGLAGLTVLAGCGGSASRHPLSAAEVDCMARAMYFESHRSSRDGMVAVGTVVMNRVHSDAFPDTVCGVVGQKNQFAPGVMSKPMSGASATLARETAQAVIAGERHPKIARAKFFHAAWYQASYNNMHYVVTTGGNAFYEKRRPELVTSPYPLPAFKG
ncbi:hypothetical protein DSM107133_01117 [Pseudosulfitobacter sp. DSM 107133]|nr:hypothetical protein DSM107133_01117 [Pseudosulfitobacter sp. DSM 107133]